MDEGVYSNIREILGGLVGARIIDISQHDQEHFEETGESFVEFLFDNGHTLRVTLTDDSRLEYDDNEPEADPPQSDTAENREN
jgi:hypothetical protein